MKRPIIWMIIFTCLSLDSAGCKLTTKNTDALDNLLPKIVPAEKVAHYQRDVVYATPSGTPLTLDVSWPEGEGPFPMLVWVHGGNYDHFSKESGEALAHSITNHG
jgi:acetyl esterase/lipase